MSIKTKIENHAVVFFLGIVVSAFAAGFGARQGLIAVNEQAVVPKETLAWLKAEAGSSELAALKSRVQALESNELLAADCPVSGDVRPPSTSQQDSAPAAAQDANRALRLRNEVSELEDKIEGKQSQFIEVSSLADASRRSCLGIGEGANPSQCNPWQERKAQAEQLSQELASSREELRDAKRLVRELGAR
jgi:hypothetical protein